MQNYRLNFIAKYFKFVRRHIRELHSLAIRYTEEEIAQEVWNQNNVIQSTNMQAIISKSYSTDEENNLYIPEQSTLVFKGDGYTMTFENTSKYDKSLNYYIRHRVDVVVYHNPPPMFDEGEE